ncbi:MAG TPA: alpha/beta hydrolase-fold protein [Bryobacteraceae bacterium]
MKPTSLLLPMILAALGWAQTNLVQELVETARLDPHSVHFSELLAKEMPKGGIQVWGQDYLFAAASDQPVTISIDEQPAIPSTAVPGTNLWYTLVKMRTGVTHEYQFFAAGKPLGNRGDATGYNPDSYPKASVPRGVLSEKHSITSTTYPGMTADFWYYASPGVDPAKPSALMIWQDGQGLIDRDRSRLRLFTVTENLIAQHLMPPVVYVMIAPGFVGKQAMRAVEYDTVSDKYPRFVMEEVLPVVERTYKLRSDGYSRAIGGESSGAICSFNAAWFYPEKFARVHSTIGSYTSIKWHVPENSDGGNAYPFKVRKEPKRNIRIWMSDGRDDLENTHGSWPLQNIQLANSLKMQGYDYHFRFGTATHNSAQAALDLPESLAWLWRDYDPAKTEQVFEQDPGEKDKPLYRVKLLNRDAW